MIRYENHFSLLLTSCFDRLKKLNFYFLKRKFYLRVSLSTGLIWTDNSCTNHVKPIKLFFLSFNHSFLFFLFMTNRSPPTARKSLANNNSGASDGATTTNSNTLSPQSGQKTRNRSRSPTPMKNPSSPSTTEHLQVLFRFYSLVVVLYFHLHRYHV